jgi:hypothetical protein
VHVFENALVSEIRNPVRERGRNLRGRAGGGRLGSQDEGRGNRGTPVAAQSAVTGYSLMILPASAES